MKLTKKTEIVFGSIEIFYQRRGGGGAPQPTGTLEPRRGGGGKPCRRRIRRRFIRTRPTITTDF